MRPMTCIVTIHGIGFQQAREGDAQGYADELHRRLKTRLAADLSDDPGPPVSEGAVYVQSRYKIDGKTSEENGVGRLGHWNDGRTAIDLTNEPDKVKLRTGDQPFAHVALVYSSLEEGQVPQHGSFVEGTLRATLALSHYATVVGLIRTAVSDAVAMAETTFSHGATPSPSLYVRRDLVSPKPRAMQPAPSASSSSEQPHADHGTGLWGTLRALENDWAAYVCRNDLRDRIRDFVREALTRLAYREDVGNIVVNSHSQGTVVALDVLRSLPSTVADRVAGLITAGSPLRKYVELLAWGNDAGAMQGKPWINLWDPRDPVADPLGPRDWKLGDRWPPNSPFAVMYRCANADTGDWLDMSIEDVRVDNVSNSSGSLRAHNYWDNTAEGEFVVPVAKLLETVAARPQPVPTAPAPV